MAILKRWFEEVWNQGREATIDELLGSDAIAHGLVDADGKEVKGAESFKDIHRAFLTALPDLNIEVEDIVSEGDLSVARFVVTGTHSGEGLGKPPKGRPVRFTGMVMVKLKDGKLAEAWNSIDFATMFQQME